MHLHGYTGTPTGASMVRGEPVDVLSATAPARAPFVRVPNALLGKLHDGGRASAHAAYLLAIKASKGTGFTLNEVHVRR